MATTYRVNLVKGFPYPQRIRAGITVRAEGYTGPLSDEQVEAIRADDQLTLKPVDEKKVAAPKKQQSHEKAQEGSARADTAEKKSAR